MAFHITYDDISLYEPENGRPLLDPVCDLEAGSAGSLSFRIPPGHPYHDHRFALRSAAHEVRLYQDNVELFRGRITKIAEDDLACVVIEAEGQLAYLADSVVRPYATYDAMDAPSGTQFVGGDLFVWEIDQHSQHVGPEKAFTPGQFPLIRKSIANSSYSTTLDDLKDVFCEGQDRYLRARSEGMVRYIDLLDGGVGEGTQAIVLGENLISVDASREASDIVTAIVPVGRKPASEDSNGDSSEVTDEGGDVDAPEASPSDPPEVDPHEDMADISIDNGYRNDTHEFTIVTLPDGNYPIGDGNVLLSHGVVSNQELTKLYGVIEEKREYEAADQEELLRLAAADLSMNKLSNQEISSVVVSAIDLNALNPDIEPIRLLDWYHVFSKTHRIDQWIPCSKIHLALDDPGNSTYRFGDLPATLTRMSALRMGMLRRGNGELIRKQNGSAWNTNKAWDKAEEVGRETDEVRKEVEDWYAEQGETDAQIFAGLDDLIKQYVELGGNIDDLRDYINEQVDVINDNVIDGVGEAIAAAQRTQYGVCPTPAGTLIKEVTVSVPGDEAGKYPFKLEAGATCTVYFQHENEQSGIYLKVNGTSACQIYTNGAPEAFWLAGATVPFVFDGRFWQNCSTPIFGTEVTIGNPGQANFYSNGTHTQMRIGNIDYFDVNMAGQRIGREDSGNQRFNRVLINTDAVTIHNKYGTDLICGYDDAHYAGTISCTDGVVVSGGYNFTELCNSYGSFSCTSDGPIIGYDGGVTRLTFGIHGIGGYHTNGRNWIMRTIVVSGNGTDELTLSPSTFDLRSLADYAVFAMNGDSNAKDAYVIGQKLEASSLTIKFDRAVSGSIRLNVFGIPVFNQTNFDPGNPEGPETFDNQDEQQEGPSTSAPDAREEPTLSGGKDAA